jgi:hypothetical protein
MTPSHQLKVRVGGLWRQHPRQRKSSTSIGWFVGQLRAPSSTFGVLNPAILKGSDHNAPGCDVIICLPAAEQATAIHHWPTLHRSHQLWDKHGVSRLSADKTIGVNAYTYAMLYGAGMVAAHEHQDIPHVLSHLPGTSCKMLELHQTTQSTYGYCLSTTTVSWSQSVNITLQLHYSCSLQCKGSHYIAIVTSLSYNKQRFFASTWGIVVQILIWWVNFKCCTWCNEFLTQVLYTCALCKGSSTEAEQHMCEEHSTYFNRWKLSHYNQADTPSTWNISSIHRAKITFRCM